MTKPRLMNQPQGFSMVEMLVALVFIMVLMAGMTKVFQASLTTFYTSGEKLSSSRRNRMATDLLYDDLNMAGMTLVDITSSLPSGSTNPAFYIIPNVTITGAGVLDPATTDEVYMAYDQPLSFEGKLTSGGGAGSVGTTAASKVLAGGSTVAADDTYVIDCGDPSYAKSVKVGMAFQIKDNLGQSAFSIVTASPSGNAVTVTTTSVTAANSPSLQTSVTGRGDPGTVRTAQRVANAGVVFIQPNQMVRYHIVMMNLDPTNANGIPCLVREQGTYDPNNAFTPTASLTQVITENVAGFKAYLSADSGQTWAGSAVTTTTLATGWFGTAGIQAALNTQIAGLKSQNFTDTSNPAWYRNIPVLVRLDLTTRTANQRQEYATAANQVAHKAAYKDFTQSLVMLPRHFGLPLN